MGNAPTTAKADPLQPQQLDTSQRPWAGQAERGEEAVEEALHLGTDDTLEYEAFEFGANPLMLNRGTVQSAQPQLRFHPTMYGDGANCEVLKGGLMARRRDERWRALAFSDRPIGVGEVVCVRISELDQAWSGTMKFGITSPTNFLSEAIFLADLPEQYLHFEAVLQFGLSPGGRMHLGVCEKHKGVLLADLDVCSGPVHFVAELSGRCLAIEFVDPLPGQSDHGSGATRVEMPSTSASVIGTDIFPSHLISDHSGPNEIEPQSERGGPAEEGVVVPFGGLAESGSECCICLERAANTVLYRCGHKCMCFGCAKETQQNCGFCPICRSPIVDVIRYYSV